ncbi:unnamed protein product [Lupinus luteus]|uniref:Uncharacterized protein n=1 Tax=Lupinus luteus TaxID=3873 RepID=A0AAV1YEP4_LUPLU
MISNAYVLEDEAGASTIEIPPDVVPNIKANAVSPMEAARVIVIPLQSNNNGYIC